MKNNIALCLNGMKEVSVILQRHTRVITNSKVQYDDIHLFSLPLYGHTNFRFHFSAWTLKLNQPRVCVCVSACDEKMF